MSKVYIVWFGDNYEHEINKVFTTREKAQAYVDGLPTPDSGSLLSVLITEHEVE